MQRPYLHLQLDVSLVSETLCSRYFVVMWCKHFFIAPLPKCSVEPWHLYVLCDPKKYFWCINHWIKVFLIVCSYHVTYAFQSESTLYSCLNVKELLAQNRHDIWSLSDRNETRIHNHLVHKWKLSHLAKLVKWLSCVVTTYLCGGFDSMLWSCHVCVS